MRRKWFDIKDATQGPVQVYIYGDIGASYFGEETTTAADFVRDLAEVSPSPIDLHVNSGGGEVFEAYAIYTALRRYEGTVTAYIDGLAASCASFIPMAATEIVMSDVAYLMIHDASSITWGNAADMRSTADQLDAIDETIISIYVAKSGRDAQEIRQAMHDTTWLTSTDALEWGLVDRIDEDGLKAAACLSREDAKRYASIPSGVIVGGIVGSSDTRRIIPIEDEAAPTDLGSEGCGGQEPDATPESENIVINGKIYTIGKEQK